MQRAVQVLVLAGGVDTERAVSLRSAAALVHALNQHPDYHATLQTVDQVTPESLGGLGGDVIWPMLHGPVGEGGPVQDALVADGRPFVGSGPWAARRAMDKLASKIEAAALGFETPPACILRTDDAVPPLPFPLVIKPVAEGSTIGLHICRDESQWSAARANALATGRVCMVEQMVAGREMTIPLIVEEGGSDPTPLAALPSIEIVPAEGLYDYQAKYERNDTRYLIATQHPDPERDRSLAHATQRSIALCRWLGIRHLARVDVILDSNHTPWFLEVNTMPGFTDHSLLPMAAAAAGIDMTALGARILRSALQNH
ncbi:MAG: D-alanine--D-alanine ligase family protein [Phycisphaerales bacterium]